MFEFEKIANDINFIKKVLHIGEHDRAKNMCFGMIKKYSDNKYIHFQLDIKEILLDIYILNYHRILKDSETLEGNFFNSDQISEAKKLNIIEEKFDYLFDRYMTLNKESEACKILLKKSNFFEDDRQLASLTKLINIFSFSNSTSIIENVIEAFELKISMHSPSEDAFFELYYQYLKYLQKYPIYEKKIIDIFDELNGELTSQEETEKLIKLIYSYKKLINYSYNYEIEILLANNLKFSGSYEKALACYFEILISKSEKNLGELLFGISDCFIELEQYDNANIFLSYIVKNENEIFCIEHINHAKELWLEINKRKII